MTQRRARKPRRSRTPTAHPPQSAPLCRVDRGWPSGFARREPSDGQADHGAPAPRAQARTPDRHRSQRSPRLHLHHGVDAPRRGYAGGLGGRAGVAARGREGERPGAAGLRVGVGAPPRRAPRRARLPRPRMRRASAYGREPETPFAPRRARGLAALFSTVIFVTLSAPPAPARLKPLPPPPAQTELTPLQSEIRAQ